LLQVISFNYSGFPKT